MAHVAACLQPSRASLPGLQKLTSAVTAYAAVTPPSPGPGVVLPTAYGSHPPFLAPLCKPRASYSMPSIHRLARPLPRTPILDSFTRLCIPCCGAQICTKIVQHERYLRGHDAYPPSYLHRDTALHVSPGSVLSPVARALSRPNTAPRWHVLCQGPGVTLCKIRATCSVSAGTIFDSRLGTFTVRRLILDSDP